MSKLIWLTDLHLVEPGREWPQGIDPLQRLRNCLSEVRQRHGDADRIVVSGDVAQLKNPGAYSLLRDELDQTGIAYRVMAGNHDDRRALLSIFPDLCGAGPFVHGFDELSDAQIVYLDTVADNGKHHGELCESRLDWIEKAFSSSDERPLLAFLHHPPADIGVAALDRLKLINADALLPLVQARKHPTFLFAGHVHRNSTGLWAGHPIATLKSTHVQFEFDMNAQKLVRSKEPPGYAVVLVDKSRVVVNYCDMVVS
ncbi:3',5'-cyclic AMP phosphodiesterase CpdA [Hydrogenophaga palleronii]|uniref:3',5'-cyclic AMP phosphodiesterase CpdA n=1 Tax=Hydrogenophaga palleronii TaxID=65655 RepID=A0ABU1WVH4_9BURK|nr:phosphodiesterase [Hydrogenophaga palleronii]MDR7152852.1 3',5'-cyclic AMP phosphodiesterase CpdA [Hydrogenophaga palleronii]